MFVVCKQKPNNGQSPTSSLKPFHINESCLSLNNSIILPEQMRSQDHALTCLNKHIREYDSCQARLHGNLRSVWVCIRTLVAVGCSCRVWCVLRTQRLSGTCLIHIHTHTYIYFLSLSVFLYRFKFKNKTSRSSHALIT